MSHQPRRNYFIKKAFQSEFALRFIFLIFLAAMSTAALFLATSRNTLTTGFHGAELKIERTSAFFTSQLFLISLGVIAVLGVLGIIVFILLSHRIAGPLYRLEKDLEKISEGNLTFRVRLRKSDQLEDLAKSVNYFVGSMDERVGKLRAEIHALAELVDQDITKGDASLDLSKLRGSVKRLKEMSDSFQTSF